MKEIGIIIMDMHDDSVTACLPFEREQYDDVYDIDHRHIDMRELFELVNYKTISNSNGLEVDEVSPGLSQLLSPYKDCNPSGSHPYRGDFWTELGKDEMVEYHIHFEDGTTIAINKKDEIKYSIDDLLHDLTLETLRNIDTTDDEAVEEAYEMISGHITIMAMVDDDDLTFAEFLDNIKSQRI